MTALYELKKEYLDILEKYENAENEDELVEVAILLGNIKGEFSEKLDSCGRIYRNLTAEAEKFEAEADRLNRKASTLHLRAERLKNYIALTLGEGVKAKTDMFSFSWRASSAVKVDNINAVPEQYKRIITVTEPNKKAIKEDIEAGLEVPGCVLEMRSNLQIK